MNVGCKGEKTMLGELFALAVLGVSAYCKVKDEAEKTNKDWGSLSNEEKMDCARGAMESELKKQERNLRSEIRKWDDDKVKRALEVIDYSDWKYQLIEDEATRRGL